MFVFKFPKKDPLERKKLLQQQDEEKKTSKAP